MSHDETLPFLPLIIFELQGKFREPDSPVLEVQSTVNEK